MSVHAEKAPTTTATTFEPARVNVRIKISALWTAMLFIFIYVDHFSLFRPDVRADLEAGQMGPFTVNQGVLLGFTVYIVLAALMVFISLVLPARGARIANVALSILYAVTIVGGSIGDEWYYYLLGSALEIVLLAAIAYHAWTWPKLPASPSADRPELHADHAQHTAA